MGGSAPERHACVLSTLFSRGTDVRRLECFFWLLDGHWLCKGYGLARLPDLALSM
jgi:hypothetical protein